MLTIDEYIAKMKRADKLDEFDYLKQPENMSAVMKYVMSYFNEYLSMETCDAETIKVKRTADKLEEEVKARYPKSKEFILRFYLQYRIAILKELNKWLEDIPYYEFFYSEQDFSSAAQDFCTSYKLKDAKMEEYESDIKTLIAEIKQYNTDKPSFSDMLHIDSNLVAWVKDTYRQYGVNLFKFTSNLAEKYYERYVKYERVRYEERGYYVNNYNHRYNNNPFDIERIYEDNKHRLFLENKRGEIEMLVMHEWLFENVYDDDYWPEYVNLCISRGRVQIVKNVNALIPVKYGALNYPEDAPCVTEHIVTTDGILKEAPQAYILRVDISQTYPGVWQNTEDMQNLITALNASFKAVGVPKVLEVTAPSKTVSFNDEVFFACCSLIEKKLKKYHPMKVAIVNGLEIPKSKQKSPKPISYLNTIEDLVKLKVQLRERKIQLRFSIDFLSLLSNKRVSKYSHRETFGALAQMKNSIVCLNITNISNNPTFSPKLKEYNNDLDVYYLNRFKYPTYDDFYTMLSATFNDTQKRYLIPAKITHDAALEELVDNLLRCGFSFCDGGEQHE